MTAVIDDLELMLAITMDAAPEPSWREIIAQDIEELRASGSLAGTLLDPFTDNDLLSPKGGWPGRGYCLHCWAKLGRRRRSYCSAECRRAYERETRRTETEDFGAAVGRMLVRYGRRVADGDIAALGGLGKMVAGAEDAMRTGCSGLLVRGHSWTEIGRELGVSRQGARQRWGRAS